MDTKPLATKLARQHGTCDPFRIVAALGFIVIDTPLVGIRGYHQYIHRCHIIYLDSHLPEQERRWVCAHELGHALLHKGLNRIFMDARTHMVTSRYEREADRFAIDLLYSDDFLQDFLGGSALSVAEHLDVSFALAEYRMSTVLPAWV